MAKPDALVPGNCYFLLQFHDDDLLFPEVMTLTYVRTEHDDHGRRLWLFEDPPSADPPAVVEPDDDRPSFFAFGDEELYQILDFPALLRALGEVAADHPIQAPAAVAASPAAGDPFADLQPQLAEFLGNPDLVGLTITVLFTDDGLSFDRIDEGMKVSFFLSARLEVEQEQQIRAIFAATHNTPRTDHLSNRGRTRILSYTIAENVGEMAALSRRILKEVYGMRDSDALRFSTLTRADIARQS